MQLADFPTTRAVALNPNPSYLALNAILTVAAGVLRPAPRRQCLALMEAMARGVPVISTEISGIPELISDGKSGYLAKPGDPETLARAIQKYLSDPDKAGKVNMARQRIEQEFCQSINVDRLTKVFALAAD
jgi:glycosyltransferase involved in cell wall biosynthesis